MLLPVHGPVDHVTSLCDFHLAKAKYECLLPVQSPVDSDGTLLCYFHLAKAKYECLLPDESPVESDGTLLSVFQLARENYDCRYPFTGKLSCVFNY